MYIYICMYICISHSVGIKRLGMVFVHMGKVK